MTITNISIVIVDTKNSSRNATYDINKTVWFVRWYDIEEGMNSRGLMIKPLPLTDKENTTSLWDSKIRFVSDFQDKDQNLKLCLWFANNDGSNKECKHDFGAAASVKSFLMPWTES